MSAGAVGGHIDARGRPVMVDVGAKADTAREAVACGRLVMDAETFARYRAGDLPKGRAEDVARIAGIQAAKRTAELIPMCHPLALTHVSIDLETVDGGSVQATATVRCTGPTGVEMEALTAVSVALLTLYDMLKGIEAGMRIEGVRLLRKSGGASGTWRAADNPS